MSSVNGNDEAWKWLNRDLPDSFFFEKPKNMTKEDMQARFDEIPEFYKALASVMISLATQRNAQTMWKDPRACMLYRFALFSIYSDAKEAGNELPLPHSWFVDGPMILPEHIVRITNGLVLWECDESVKGCGWESNAEFPEGCIYHSFKFPQNTSKDEDADGTLEEQD